MANICEYKGIVRGPKNACYAVFGSMSCFDDKYICEENGTDEDYFLRFEGDCKWDVDSYCNKRDDLTPFNIPEDCDEAEEFGANNWYIPQQQKPILFGVDFQIAWADVEDYDPDFYSECGCNYVHYDKNGAIIDDDCPEDLIVSPREY